MSTVRRATRGTLVPSASVIFTAAPRWCTTALHARRAMEEGRAELAKKHGMGEQAEANTARAAATIAARPAPQGPQRPVQKFAGYGVGFAADPNPNYSQDAHGQSVYADKKLEVVGQGTEADKEQARLRNLKRDGFSDETLSPANRYSDGSDQITPDIVRPPNDPDSIRHTSSYLEMQALRKEEAEDAAAAARIDQADKDRARHSRIEAAGTAMGHQAPKKTPAPSTTARDGSASAKEGESASEQTESNGSSAIIQRPVATITKMTKKKAPKPFRRANTPPPNKHELAAVAATFESKERAARGVKGVQTKHTDDSVRYGSIFAEFDGEREIYTPKACDDHAEISPKKTKRMRVWVMTPNRVAQDKMSPPVADASPLRPGAGPENEGEFTLHQEPVPLHGVLAKGTYFVNHNKHIVVPLAFLSSATFTFCVIQSLDALVANPAFGLLVGVLVAGGMARLSASYFLVYYFHFGWLSLCIGWAAYQLFLDSEHPPDVWANLYGKRPVPPEWKSPSETRQE